MKIKNVILSVSFVGVLLAGCSHGPVVQDYATTASPAEELTKLNLDMDLAVKNQVDALSPTHFNEARGAQSDAKNSLEKQRDPKDTLHKIAESRAYLNMATKASELSHQNMEDVVSARLAAVTAGAPGYFKSDFQRIDGNLKDVTTDLEKNDTASAAQRRSEFQAAYLAIELRAIKHANLEAARSAVTLAKKEGASEYAPRSLAIAEKSLLDTEAFITANRHDAANVSTRSAQSLASANHVLKINRDSKAGKKVSSEDAALTLEGAQTQATQARSQLVDTKVELADSQEELNSEKGANRALSAENKSLESDQTFNESFEEARAEFTKEEAEVYKQGNTLMIRLRGLEFPTSQAVIKGSNFALLSKLSKVIQGFGKSKVIIEGHTDSVGDKDKNEKLSSERAEAVRDYLASNGVTATDLTAIGYGYQKPLGTNKTKEGRAQNRRVDVRISPAKTATL